MISDEWAKQLAKMGFADAHDFDKMKVFRVPPGTLTWRFEAPVVFTRMGDSPRGEYSRCTEVTMQQWCDPINQEITRIGYDAGANVLLVGETKYYRKDTP